MRRPLSGEACAVMEGVCYDTTITDITEQGAPTSDKRNKKEMKMKNRFLVSATCNTFALKINYGFEALNFPAKNEYECREKMWIQKKKYWISMNTGNGSL